MPLLTVSSLYKRFNLEAGFFARFGRFVNAVNDISFSIGKNEAYGLVGESGCGKTTTARLLVRMYETDSGEIVFYQEDTPSPVAKLQKEELRQYREKVRYVFQDPARSLNPRMSVYEVLVSGCRRPLKTRGVSEKDLRQKAAAILEEVGLQAADLEKRPSEFVSIQGQILNLLLDIRKKRNMSFLFIAHDLKVACYFCDRIGVMYSGELVEEAPASSLWREGQHPYTKMLFASAAVSGKQPQSSSAIPKTEAANNTTALCAFAPRCPLAQERCYSSPPPMVQIAANHKARCHCINEQ